MQHLALVVCLFSALWYAWSLYAVVRTRASVPMLRDDASPAPSRWPRVSIIVAARDEARDLERGVRTRLADDYPDLQVVIVDDRSSDETPAIADRLAADDARVRVVHLTELPDGWLGKLHAMHRGVEVADGEWLLFSDADIEFAPGTLRRCLSHCEHHGRDHMAVLPEFREHGLAVDSAMDVFCQNIVVAGRLWAVTDPSSSAAVGGGMFNLVRRVAFDRTPGFEWLRLEVADDVALGQMLKRHGARPVVMNAVGAVMLDFYTTLGEMAYGTEKTGFAIVGRFSVATLLAVLTLGAVTHLGFVAGFAHPAPWVKAVAAATLLVAWAGYMLIAQWGRRSMLTAALFPVGFAAMAWMALRSAWLVKKRGGVAWRHTLYPVEALRKGSRLTFL